MKKSRVLVLVGGISKDSLNKKLYRFFADSAPEALELDYFDISQLPFFSQDIENDPPAAAADFKDRIVRADALLIITPEYNRSFPGVLKNALDWGSRPQGKGVWGGKPAGLMGTSPGAIGTFGAQHQIRQVLSFLDIRTMNQPEFYFTFPKELPDGKLPAPSQEFLQKFIDSFVKWIDKQNG